TILPFARSYADFTPIFVLGPANPSVGSRLADRECGPFAREARRIAPGRSIADGGRRTRWAGRSPIVGNFGRADRKRRQIPGPSAGVDRRPTPRAALRSQA